MNVYRSILVLSVLVVAGCTAGAPESTSATTTTTASTLVTSSTAVTPEVVDAQPPPLLVVFDGRQVTVPGFDYCWQESGSGQGTCADWFGTEVPTRVEVDTAEVIVQWVNDGILTAGVRNDGDSCQPALAMEEAGEGTWRMAMPELPATYRIDLYGMSPQGSTRFALEVTTSAAGPVAAPVATLWWPDTSSQFEPFVSIVGPGSGTEARLLIVSSDNSSTELPMEAVFLSDVVSDEEVVPPIRCDTTFLIRHEDGPITFEFNEDVLGHPPYEVTLTIGVMGPEFERTWVWPDELDSEDILTGSMHPTSGEPWNPKEDSDPLIDSSG